MKRIIDLEKIILKEDEVLAEIFQKKSLIITSAAKGTDMLDYCKVISVGELVHGIKKDDILLQLDAGEVFEIGKRTFVVVRRYAINIAVNPDNILLDNSNQA